MTEKEFRDFLKRSGRKPNVIDKYVKFFNNFKDFLDNHRVSTKEGTLTESHLLDFISNLEKKSKKPARTELYALMQYFKATKNESMFKTAKELREGRKAKTSPLQLKKILGHL